MYPFLGVALLEVCLQGSVNGLLRVDGLFNTLTAHHGQPRLERFGLLGGDGLDDAEKLFGIGNVGLVPFPVLGRLHFQLVTFSNQLGAFV